MPFTMLKVTFENAHGVQTFSGKAFKGGLKQSHDISGNLIVPSNKGCPGSQVPSKPVTNTSNGLVLLVERGDCLFFDKVATAETNGVGAYMHMPSLPLSDAQLFSWRCSELHPPCMR